MKFCLPTDIGFSDGPVWEVQRNLVIQCMKNSGLGKSSMEGIVNDSIHDVIQTLLSNDGKIIEMKNMFFMAITTTTWRMITGPNNECDVHDKNILDFDNDIRALFKELRPDALFNIYPWLRFVPPNGFGFKPFIKANKRVLSYLRPIIDSHEKTLVDGYEVDFIDHYLAKMKQHNGSRAPKPPYTTDHLLGSLWDIFLAGHDTTNSSLLWGFLFLSCNPEVQIKAQRELDSVVGRNRLPNLDDFSRLPYIEAVIMEIHRLANVAPLSVPHRCNQTTEICNVIIPKGATVLQNIHAVHMDPYLWEEPSKFKPERYINENQEIKWPPYLMPFSIGPRLCIGKSIADIELKLFISCLLHQFKFSLPPNRPKPSMESTIGLTIHPQPYCLLVNHRKE
ncbi:Cytochrome P450 2 sub R member 1, variant 2 [Chamberlinius hualienensis]